jgi:hypothetical protein
MNKRNLIFGVGLMIVVIIALLISANKPGTLVTKENPLPKVQTTYRPIDNYTNRGGYSGNDPYDPSIHEYLLSTLQACVTDSNGDGSNQLAMQLDCNAQAPDLKSTPTVVPAVK